MMACPSRMREAAALAQMGDASALPAKLATCHVSTSKTWSQTATMSQRS